MALISHAYEDSVPARDSKVSTDFAVVINENDFGGLPTGNRLAFQLGEQLAPAIQRKRVYKPEQLFFIMKIDSFINDTVSYLVADEKKRSFASKKLSKLKIEFPKGIRAIQEGAFSFSVEKAVLNESISGVDSGFVSKRLANLEMVFIRTVGTVFNYENGKLKNCDYYPDYYHFPEPKISNGGLDADEMTCSTSLIRLVDEVKTAEETIKKFKPKFAFLDGSIIPQYADKPRKDSKVHKFYRGVINEFQELYEIAEKNNCCLIGCVEDSRGSRIREILQKEVLPKTDIIKPEFLDDMLDSMLLDSTLDLGERSFAFPYTSGVKEHPILMDYNDKWANNIYVFYIKAAELDRPLRVEFLKSKSEGLTEKTEKVASVVYGLSSMHREYAYPSVLIEADLRARLRPEEIDTVYNKIMDRLSVNTRLTMRRSNRPF